MTTCPERSVRVNALRATGAGLPGLFGGPWCLCVGETQARRPVGASPPGTHHPGPAQPRRPVRAPRGCLTVVPQTTVARKRYKGVPMSLVEVEAPRQSADAGATPPEEKGSPPTREIRHE